MNYRNVAAVAAALTLAMGSVHGALRSRGATIPSADDASVQSAIATAVETGRKRYGGRTPVPGVLVGVWDGRGGSFIHGYGFADVKAQRRLRRDDHFRIGSNTKTFVVATILQLVDEGRLKLDDPISKFSIGVQIPNAEHITVRQLCNMRSGLFEGYDTPQFQKLEATGKPLPDARELIGWAAAQKPHFAPGTGYNYSNTNYLVLGLIIETVTKRSVADEIRTRLIEPFGLTQTSYPTSQAMPEPWARGYGLDAHRNWEDVSGTVPVSLMGAAGAMISDMGDMRRWIVLVVDGKTSAPATHRELMTCLPVEGNLAFGLGLGCSAGWYGYTGGLPGYNTANYYFPKTGAFVTVWVDVQSAKPFPGVANSIFRDIARALTPDNVPFQSSTNKSGL